MYARLNEIDSDPVTISLDGGRQLAYTEYGDPAGVPVTFFHGTPGSRVLGALFDTVAEAAGIRLVAFDRPGFGRSSPWPDRSIDDAGTYLPPILDDAEVETTRLIAFSGGGPQAFAAAEMHSDRISRLDVVSGATPPGVSEATPTLQRLLGRMAMMAPTVLRGLLRGQCWLAKQLDPSFVLGQYTTAESDGTVPERAADIVRADFVEALADYRRGTVAELRSAGSMWDVNLDGIDTVVHLWHGTHDTNVPLADVRRFRSHLPDAQLTVLEGADHFQTLLQSIHDILEPRR